MSCWLYVECDLCGERVPVVTEHESWREALKTHKREIHLKFD